METSADEIEGALQSVCEAAELWAKRLGRGHTNIRRNKNDNVDSDNDIGEESDDETSGDEVEQGEERPEGSHSEKGAWAGKGNRDGEGHKNEDRGVEEREEEDIGEGWHVVSSSEAKEDQEKTKGSSKVDVNNGVVGGGSSIKSSSSSSRDTGKVELGERERARTADIKEALKAGIFLP